MLGLGETTATGSGCFFLRLDRRRGPGARRAGRSRETCRRSLVASRSGTGRRSSTATRGRTTSPRSADAVLRPARSRGSARRRRGRADHCEYSGVWSGSWKSPCARQYASPARPAPRSAGEACSGGFLVPGKTQVAPYSGTCSRWSRDRRAGAPEAVAEVLDNCRRHRRRGGSASREPRSVAVAPSGSGHQPEADYRGTSMETGSPRSTPSASIRRRPARTPRPLIIVVCESVPMSVSGTRTVGALVARSTTRARYRVDLVTMPCSAGRR